MKSIDDDDEIACSSLPTSPVRFVIPPLLLSRSIADCCILFFLGMDDLNDDFYSLRFDEGAKYPPAKLKYNGFMYMFEELQEASPSVPMLVKGR